MLINAIIHYNIANVYSHLQSTHILVDLVCIGNIKNKINNNNDEGCDSQYSLITIKGRKQV